MWGRSYSGALDMEWMHSTELGDAIIVQPISPVHPPRPEVYPTSATAVDIPEYCTNKLLRSSPNGGRERP
jgi:hypothetical protein